MDDTDQNNNSVANPDNNSDGNQQENTANQNNNSVAANTPDQNQNAGQKQNQSQNQQENTADQNNNSVATNTPDQNQLNEQQQDQNQNAGQKQNQDQGQNQQENTADQNNKNTKPAEFEKIAIKKTMPLKLMIGIIAIILIGIIAYLFAGNISHKTATTTVVSTTIPKTSTTTTTTIRPVQFYQINSCRDINASGSYSLNASFKPNNKNESCININANNVSLSCNNLNITGLGPFINTPPFTYGINISNRKNITISKCAIKSFSYGIYSNNSRNISILNNNVSNNFMANLALINSSNVNVSDNYFLKAETHLGSVYLAENSSNVLLKNNSILYNAFLGINVSSSKNLFINNYINGTPEAFYCGLNNSFPISSKAVSNICYNNTACGFVSCHGFNTPSNLSFINLSNKLNVKKQINECGSINKAGVYSLNENVNMSNFINTSNPLVNSSKAKCININSNNVTINCNNHFISNAPIGIYASNKINISLENCKIQNSYTGIKFTNIISGNLTNIKINNTDKAFLINNSSSVFMSYFNMSNNTYGLYLLNSRADSFNKFDLLNNVYGLYDNGSIGNIFTNATVMNNSKIDVYATTNNKANITSANLMQNNISCGVTDADWAPCKLHLSVSLAYFPVTSCEVISRSGNYSLINNIIASTPNCLNINANNVKLSCSKYSITGASGLLGAAVFIENKTNITINSCNIYGFDNGINAYNSSKINITNSNIKSTLSGILFNKINSSKLINNKVSGTANTSIILNNTINSNVINNNVSYGLSSDIGLLIKNSTNNIIENNTGLNNNIGLYLKSESNNNLIKNNLMDSNSQADYLCSNNNSNINAELNGINYGNIKVNCDWLVALSKLNPNLNCPFISSSALISLSSDFIYPYGSTCYQISNSNDSTINCRGHTIIATKAGNFATLKNAKNIEIENCYLKGFNNPIIANNSSVKIINTLFYNNFSINSTAINISKSDGAKVTDNKIIGYITGILFTKDLNSFIENNTDNSIYSYIVSNSVNIKISNNTSSNQSLTGLKLSNSTSDLIFNNTFFGKDGITCLFKSQNSSSNLDFGNNKCSVNNNCSWIIKSNATCH